MILADFAISCELSFLLLKFTSRFFPNTTGEMNPKFLVSSGQTFVHAMPDGYEKYLKKLSIKSKELLQQFSLL